MKKKHIVALLVTAAIATAVLILYERSDAFHDLIVGSGGPYGI